MSFNRHRVSSVSFTRSHTLSDPNDVPSDEDDNIQITLAPHIQNYLARAAQRRGCLGRCLPIPFERAARRSWCNPHFDSEILEGQYKTSAFPQLRLRFRYALLYVLLVSVSWFVYFLSAGLSGMSTNWPVLCSILAALMAVLIGLLLLTHTDFFRVHFHLISICVAFMLYALSLCFVLFTPSRFSPFLEFSADISPVGHFSMCVEVLLLVYTVIPLPLYVCVILGLLYSTTFELLTLLLHDSFNYLILIRFLAQICIHLIGLHILIMTNVRMRGTFMKVGQSLLVRRQLEMEKQLKEKMIHSVMPPKLADWLMNDDANFAKNSEPRTSNPETTYFKSLFRPFNMHRMENVSILFADIVGFTKMSSNKSAEELVGILNDLFERFDHLCSLHECEKISTLGDCYYCVSGCPEPRADHAKCCVEMGLGMIQAIKQFDAEKNDGVNMRVGVHTGTVLCGIVGTRRFKFDVWSNDVTLANRMESTGKPGMVHISEKTCEFLPDLYILDEGEPVFGYKTYFIMGRKSDRHSTFNGSLRPTSSHKFDSLQLIISPSISPPSVSPLTRPRVLSCNDGNLKTHSNPNQLSPNMFKIKANSLPSILDSDCEDTEEQDEQNVEDSSVKSPTSVQSCEKNYTRTKKWKIPKFLRKQSTDIHGIQQQQSDRLHSLRVDVSELQSSNGYQQVPAIVETNCCSLEANCCNMDTSCCKNSSQENDNNFLSDSSWSSYTKTEDPKDKSNLEENKNDIIDVKSYISQSRSDVGQFDYSPISESHPRCPSDILRLDRAGSNKSHTGRLANYDVSPVARARSATMAARVGIDMDCLEIPNSGISIAENHISECASVNSRKDSGIRSTSRRSSIQQQIYVMNQNSLPQEDLLQARVSGYYTSSQSTLNSCSPHYGSHVPPFCDQLGHRFQKLRKQSDLQLIRCVQDNFKSKHSYFMKPPLSNITLCFKSPVMEREYRENVHTISDRPGEMLPTLATSRYNTYFDILVSAIIFFIVVASLFILYIPTVYSLAVITICVSIQFFAVVLCIRQIIRFTRDIFNFFSEWYRWHTFGAFIISLPVVAILSSFSCSNTMTTPNVSDCFYCYLFFVSIIHFCNFTQFNCWMKNGLATIFAVVFLCLVTILGDSCVHNNTSNAMGRYSFNSGNGVKSPAIESLALENLAQNNLVSESLALESLTRESMLRRSLVPESFASESFHLETRPHNILVSKSLTVENRVQRSLTSASLTLDSLRLKNLPQNLASKSTLEDVSRGNIEESSMQKNRANLALGKLDPESLSQESLVRKRVAKRDLFLNTVPLEKTQDNLTPAQRSSDLENLPLESSPQINTNTESSNIDENNMQKNRPSESQKPENLARQNLVLRSFTPQSFSRETAVQKHKISGSLVGKSMTQNSLVRGNSARENLVAENVVQESKIAKNLDPQRFRLENANQNHKILGNLAGKSMTQDSLIPGNFARENLLAENIIQESKTAKHLAQKSLSSENVVLESSARQILAQKNEEEILILNDTVPDNQLQKRVSENKENMSLMTPFLRSLTQKSMTEKSLSQKNSAAESTTENLAQGNLPEESRVLQNLNLESTTQKRSPLEHFVSVNLDLGNQSSLPKKILSSTVPVLTPQGFQEKLPHNNLPQETASLGDLSRRSSVRGILTVENPALKHLALDTESLVRNEMSQRDLYLKTPDKTQGNLTSAEKRSDVQNFTLESSPQINTNTESSDSKRLTQRTLISQGFSREGLLSKNLALGSLDPENLSRGNLLRKRVAQRSLPVERVTLERSSTQGDLTPAQKGSGLENPLLENLQISSVLESSVAENAPENVEVERLASKTENLDQVSSGGTPNSRSGTANSGSGTSNSRSGASNSGSVNPNSRGGTSNSGNETPGSVGEIIHSVHLHNISLPGNSTNRVFRTHSTSKSADYPARSEVQRHRLYQSEIFIDVVLLLVLVWFLNREFEIGYRLTFHANLVANRDKAHVQSMKNQADWLLHNIIPKHVADQLKKSAKYSENHKNVGIIFASIVNFNEMYDESYLGGKEYLRVLNELIADFDELLTLPEFRSVEKIKTIGSTFMAASGLNPEVRRDSHDPYQHLHALVEFAIAMQQVVDNFNRDLLEFNLILRVGYNFGDVTAGVIGTSKLYYDIWGDAVNIASRMDSTGVNGRIQVGGACLEVLEKWYEFEPRGSVYVKGKDNMNVFLLLRKKCETGAGDQE